MAKVNVQGRVYGGQEGSGQAQILTPFDATKFPQQEMTIKEQDKENARKETDKWKRGEVMDISTTWNLKMPEYRGEYDAYYDDVFQLDLKVAELNNIADPTERRKAQNEIDLQTADLNRRGKELEGKFKLIEEFAPIYENAAKVLNDENVKPSQTFANMSNFIDIKNADGGYWYESAGGDEVAAMSNYVKARGGTLVVPQFLHDPFQSALRSEITSRGVKTGRSSLPTIDPTTGTIQTWTINGVEYNKDDAKGIAATRIAGRQDYLEWFRGDVLGADPLLEKAILKYTGKESVNHLSQKEIQDWLLTSPEGEDWIRVQYFPNDERTAKLNIRNAPSGSGTSDPLTPDQVLTKTEGGEQSKDIDNKELEIVNNFIKTYSTISTHAATNGENIIVGGAQAYKSGDYQNSKPTITSSGLGGYYIDQATGKKIPNSEIDQSTDMKRTSGGTLWTTLKPVQYTDDSGKVVRIPEGEQLTEKDLKYLRAGEHYTVGRVVFIDSKTRKSKSNEIVSTYNIQSALGYSEFTPQKQKEEFDNSVIVIQSEYNYEINWVKASDIILNNAKAMAQQQGKTSPDGYDLYKAQEKFDKEMSTGKWPPTVMSSGTTPTSQQNNSGSEKKAVLD